MVKISHYLLAEFRIFLVLDALIVVIEGLLENLRFDAHLLGNVLARFKAFHQLSADVVLAVPLNLVRSFAIKDEANRILE